MSDTEPPPFDGEMHEESREQAIAERAYYLWLDAGSPAGTAVGDWLEAERQMRGHGAEREESMDLEASR